MGWQTLWEVGVDVSMPSTGLYISSHPPPGQFLTPSQAFVCSVERQLIYGCKSEGRRLGNQLQKSLSWLLPGYNNWRYFYDESPGYIKSRCANWTSKCLSTCTGSLRRWIENEDVFIEISIYLSIYQHVNLPFYPSSHMAKMC